MIDLNRNTLETVINLAQLSTRDVADILGHTVRRVQSWRSVEGFVSRRSPPPGEIERLCLLLDPDGQRENLIGWVVKAAKGRV